MCRPWERQTAFRSFLLPALLHLHPGCPAGCRERLFVRHSLTESVFPSSTGKDSPGSFDHTQIVGFIPRVPEAVGLGWSWTWSLTIPLIPQLSLSMLGQGTQDSALTKVRIEVCFLVFCFFSFSWIMCLCFLVSFAYLVHPRWGSKLRTAVLLEAKVHLALTGSG